MKKTRQRVLVADCHEEVLILLQKLLEEAGFDTTTVWTATEAVKLLESQTFDLVLVNEYLPDAECEALLSVLQKKAREVPCVVMQPSAPEITNVKALQRLGASEIVCKHDYEQILKKVKRYLGNDTSTLAA